jgi:hypothetical protein
MPYQVSVIEHSEVKNTLCVVTIKTLCNKETFSFNLQYLFEQVIPDHREWFLNEIFVKKLNSNEELIFDPNLKQVVADMEKIYLQPKQ